MSRYMLDTDTASYLIRGDHPEVTAVFVRNFRIEMGNLDEIKVIQC